MVISFLLFSIVILLFHSHSWIIKEGIVYFKNEYNFWIPRAKNVRNIKFYRSHSIISKIMRPSVLQFSVLKGTPESRGDKSDVTQKIQTWITHEIMEIFTYFFLQMFIIFFCLSDSNKKSYGNPGPQFPFNFVLVSLTAY